MCVEGGHKRSIGFANFAFGQMSLTANYCLLVLQDGRPLCGCCRALWQAAARNDPGVLYAHELDSVHGDVIEMARILCMGHQEAVVLTSV